MKPVLFVTGHAPPDRIGAFKALDELEGVRFALFGGRTRHGVTPSEAAHAGGGQAPVTHGRLPFDHIRVRQHELFRLCASGRYRAVVCSTGGRLALPLAWAGGRAARVPVILWSSLWAHPRTATHALGYPAMARLYRSADAVVTYGPHVSVYAHAHGARNTFIAPQAVDNEFWRLPPTGPPQHPAWPHDSAVRFLFVGRPAAEKGLAVLLDAWRQLALDRRQASLVVVGTTPGDGAWRGARWTGQADGVSYAGTLDSVQLRNFYAASDVLVVPSIRTPTFREPWGLVINEAFNQHLPAVVSDAVGAAAGGLVRDGVNGLVVPADDPNALAAALLRLANDPSMRTSMGDAAASAVGAYTYAAWAAGFSQALASVGVSLRAVSGGPPTDSPRPSTADGHADVGSFR